jgi:hypothetical protein
MVDGPWKESSVRWSSSVPSRPPWRSLMKSTTPLGKPAAAFEPCTTSSRPRSMSRPSPPLKGPPFTVSSRMVRAALPPLPTSTRNSCRHHPQDLTHVNAPS